MFCRNCGKSIPDNSPFCSNCGAQQAEAGENGQNAAPPPAGQYTPPPSPGMNTYAPPPYGAAPPPKNKGMMIALIALGAVVIVLGVVLAIILLKPKTGTGNGVNPPSTSQPAGASAVVGGSIVTDSGGTNNDTLPGTATTLPSATPDTVTNAPSQPPAGQTSSPTSQPSPGNSVEWRVFNTPVWSSEPIYQTIDLGGAWTGVGIATNPAQIDGDYGVLTLDDVEGATLHLEFFADQTCSIEYDTSEYGVETYYYEIMDIEYCDTYMDEDGFGYRFYNGDDGRLYMCGYQDMGDGTYPDVTDFIVFELLGDVVDW